MTFFYRLTIIIGLFFCQQVYGMLKEYEIEESSVQARLRQIRPISQDVYEDIQKESKIIVERNQAIENIFLRDFDATEIKLSGSPDLLKSDDMYPVARGMISRSSSEKHQRISRLDLSNNDITQAGFFTLYTAFVNRGICDEWGVCPSTQQNNLRGLTVDLRKNPIIVDGVILESLKISKEHNVIFLLDECYQNSEKIVEVAAAES